MVFLETARLFHLVEGEGRDERFVAAPDVKTCHYQWPLREEEVLDLPVPEQVQMTLLRRCGQMPAELKQAKYVSPKEMVKALKDHRKAKRAERMAKQPKNEVSSSRLLSPDLTKRLHSMCKR